MFLYSLLPHLLFSMHVYELQHILFSTHGFELEFCLSFYSNGKRDVLTSNKQKIFWTVLFESGAAEFFSMFHFSVTVVFILRLQPFWHLCSNVCAVCFKKICLTVQGRIHGFPLCRGYRPFRERWKGGQFSRKKLKSRTFISMGVINYFYCQHFLKRIFTIFCRRQGNKILHNHHFGASKSVTTGNLSCAC